MRRTVMFGCALSALLLVPQTASSRLYYGFTVGVVHAPPPPAIRMMREPRVILTGDAMVYMVDDPSLRCDGDVFRYGQYWFVYTKGYWYRARSHRGPYAVIDVLKVPRARVQEAVTRHRGDGGPGHVAALTGVGSSGRASWSARRSDL